MKELSNVELKETNGGFLIWLALTVLVACVDSPEDFMRGLQDASK